MRQIALFATILVLLSGTAATQAWPQNGDLVFAAGDGLSNWQRGLTGYVDPRSPVTTLTVLLNAPVRNIHNWVRMAPNNSDLVVAGADFSTAPETGDLWRLRSTGTKTAVSTIAHFATYRTDGYELDHDNKWILSGRSWDGFARHNLVLGVDHNSGAVTTFSSLVTGYYYNEMAIDRDPGSVPYVMLTCCGTSGPQVLGADRRGALTVVTLATPIKDGVAIELDPLTGDYIVGFVNGGHAVRMDKRGSQTTLVPSYSVNAIKILQDGTAWFANGGWSIRTLLHYDLVQRAVLTIIPSGLAHGWIPMGIDVYGSRTLVCNQQSSVSVRVEVQSRLPSAAGKHYAVAASFARRPLRPHTCLRFPTCGEYFFLDQTSPLFLLTAQNLVPGIFGKFRGTLDSSGNAVASVNIPAKLQGLAIPIFVAGVIYDRTGVLQVTSTHWFVL